MPMRNFTQQEFTPSPSAVLFVKQFARMYSELKREERLSSVKHLN